MYVFTQMCSGYADSFLLDDHDIPDFVLQVLLAKRVREGRKM